jgi:hypothetical protein
VKWVSPGGGFGYRRRMRRLFAFVLVFLAVCGFAGASLAMGICSGLDSTDGRVLISISSDTAQQPSPCEQLGGKRTMPQTPLSGLTTRDEIPRATLAQWRLGLADDPVRHGRCLAVELPPPRLA